MSPAIQHLAVKLMHSAYMCRVTTGTIITHPMGE